MKFVVPNWELLNELIVAEYKRVQASTSLTPEAKAATLAELEAQNNYVQKKAEEQS